MSKHTPGPWHVGCLGGEGKCQCSPVLSEGFMGSICQVSVDNGKLIGDGGNDAPKRDEAIANMRLIAAAPDMYEAGVNLMASLDPDQLNPEQFNAWSDMNAAVDKARTGS